MDPRTHTITSTETIKKSLISTRISPKPSYLQTLKPYPNIKHLRLESEMISPTAFHQIEGMITEALKHHRHLERIEVRSDVADWMWRLVGGAEQNRNQRWIGRINAGTGVAGKLTRASTYGGEQCWFWQAGVEETLGWNTAATAPGLKRKRV
jgi:hypothetical protein